VLQAIVNVAAFANNLSCLINDYAADEWTRAYLAHAMLGQVKGAPHHEAISLAPLNRCVAYRRCCLLHQVILPDWYRPGINRRGR
jgi:hypothetical protein